MAPKLAVSQPLVDIKPSNVFLCEPDRHGRRVVKILDFGVVKVSPARVARSFPTEQGQFIGSPACAAPEQARGEVVDARADLYAVGLLLYILIAGKSPFAGASVPQSALWAHLLTVPAPLSNAVSRAVPAALDAIVAKALAKDRDDRFATAAQMASALERLLAKLPAEEAPRAQPAIAPNAGERAGNGTVVIRKAAPPISAAADEPTAAEPITLLRVPGVPGVVPVSTALAQVTAALRRWLSVAAIALASGAIFFLLLWAVWRMLRGSP